MSVGNLFNEEWYLKNYPDVRAAVEAGVMDAWTHFDMFGRVEGRSPDPLFNPAQYLAANPDVRAAVEAGVLNAYDHFVQFGASEGRSPVALFDPEFYLSQNPDVRAAVEAGLISATEHFLLYGQGEPRQVNPFINLGDYLNANADIAAAAKSGALSPLTHLLIHGAAEGRDLGNGINLGIFDKDPAFQQAIESGNFTAAMDRVGEVAPFLPSFEPPAGWQPAPDTPIPTDFTPPEGTKLVIPPSVEVPDDVELPDTFEPVEPGPGPVDPTPPVTGETYDITTAINTYVGTAGPDTFNAEDESTIRTGLEIDGGKGTDTLNIKDGAIVKDAAPKLDSVEIINNEHVGPALGSTHANFGDTVWLDLTDVKGLKELWTDFSKVTWPDPDAGKFTEDAGQTSGVGVFYSNTESFSNTVFGVRNVNDVGTNGVNFGGHANVSFGGAGAGATLKLDLEGNEAGSFYRVGQSDNFSGYEIDVAAGNDGTLAIGVQVKNIKITGEGDLAIRARNFDKLDDVDASEANGFIHFGAVDGSSGKLGLAEGFSIKTGTGGAIVDLRGVTTTGTVDLGAGENTVYFGTGITVVGGSDDDVFVITAPAGPGNPTEQLTIVDYGRGNDVIDLTQVSGLKLNGSNGDRLEVHQGGQTGDGWGKSPQGTTSDLLVQLSGGSGSQLIIEDAYEAGTTIAFQMTETQAGLGSSNDVFLDVLVNITENGEIDATNYEDGAILSGGDGAQTLIGGAGDDIINGGAGDDIINGGAGNDILVGGDGSDSFQFHSGFGIDIIQDFEAGPDSDSIHIRKGGFEYISFSDTLNTVADLEDSTYSSAYDTLIGLGYQDDGEITVIERNADNAIILIGSFDEAQVEIIDSLP